MRRSIIRPSPPCRRTPNGPRHEAVSKTIHYLDINEKFLTDKDVLTKAIMPDYLHPNATGYQIWPEAIESKVAELMGEDR